MRTNEYYEYKFYNLFVTYKEMNGMLTLKYVYLFNIGMMGVILK